MEVIYHSIVRQARQGHRNAVVGIALNIFRSLVMVGAFLFMFLVLGLRSSPIRGDFLLFIMSGIFKYITLIRAVCAVAWSEGPASSMMKHAPMNTFIAIISSAMAALYQQVFTLAIILTIYHIAITPITIYQPMYALCIMLLAWFSGVAVGTVFLAISPWMPDFIGLVR